MIDLAENVYLAENGEPGQRQGQRLRPASG
jgi:hypothetical protein